ncbi:MAG: sulfatase [bacterium]
MDKKPNIILITVDALRSDRLGFLGCPKNISSNIDNLARESAVFTRAFSVGPNSPHSFPAILTSTYPLDFQGLYKIEKPRKILSEVLKEHGYVTAAFHSTPYLSDFFGYNRGWDFFEYITSPVNPDFFPGQGKLAELKLYLKDSLKGLFKKIAVNFYPKILFKLMYRRYLPKFKEENEPQIKAVFVNKIIKDFVLAAKAKEQPFFLFAHYMDVHSPYIPKEKDLSQPLSFAEFVSAWLPGYLGYAKKRLFRNFIKPYFEMMVDSYDQGIKDLDGQLGSLFDFLKKEAVFQNSIICFTADHGEELLEHGEGFHNAKLYNELLAVPLLIKIPGQGSQKIEKKVSQIDLPSTLCELAGIKPPANFKGKNIFESFREIIFHESGAGSKEKMNGWIEIEKLKECKFACQSDDWKYILDNPLKREELYCLEKDPKEQNDLSKSCPEVLVKMRKIMEDFQKENKPLSLLAKK